MKYFVTGATGFVGGRVARQLLDAGHQVIALVRDPAKAAHLSQLGATLAEGDVTDKESMHAPMTGVDGMFHVAGWYKVGVRDSSPGWKINVDGTRNTLELMRELGVPKGVYTSTIAIFSDTGGKLVDESYRHYGPWLSEYDRTKWVAHYEVAEPMMAAGLPLVIVQPGVVYGPGDTSTLRANLIDYLQRKLPVTPQKTALCWTHVDDAARAHLLAMDQGKAGENYIIAGEPLTLQAMFELAEKITGIPAPRMHLSPGMMKLMAATMKLVEGFARLPESYTSEGLRIVAGVTYIASNANAKRELGYTPRPLEDGLRETLAHEMRLLGMDTSAVVR